MAIQEKLTLKNYFRQGDIPTEANYVDLIDSLFAVTGSTTGNIDLICNITASGTISASGTIHVANFHVPGNGRISFDDTDTDDQFIKGLDNNITVNGHNFVHLDALNSVKVRTSGMMVNDNTAPTATLQVAGDLWVSGSNGNITASGDINASGDITGVTGSFSYYEIPDYIYHTGDPNTYFGFLGGDIFVTHVGGAITSTSTPTLYHFNTPIESAGKISGSSLEVSTHITASGNISASGNKVAQNITASGNISVGDGTSTLPAISFGSDTNTGIYRPAPDNLSLQVGGGGVELNLDSTNVMAQLTTNLYLSSGTNGHITASGNISASGTLTAGATSVGALTATTLDTGQGATEVYLMNQNVRTSDAVTFATINTGLGATEVYPMDQSVASTANVTFASFRLSKVAQSAGNFGEVITITDGLQSFTITVNNIPTIPGKDDAGNLFKTTLNQINNDAIREDSVILITSTKDLSAVAFRVSNGQCFFSIANESVSEFVDGTAQFNFTIF